MKNRLKLTLEDIEKILSREKIKYILTRNLLNKDFAEQDDLDLLVHAKDFNSTIKAFARQKYQVESHDQALGGRLKGYQKNLVKKNRIKIDLHKDFTWRKSRYIDNSFLWDSCRKQVVGSIGFYVPDKEIDAFLIYINILFEKTYITNNDREILSFREVLTKKEFVEQARKYHWVGSLKRFTNWIYKNKILNFPKFVPLSIVIYSYIEKLFYERKIDVISLAYYFFYRTRFTLNQKLPY